MIRLKEAISHKRLIQSMNKDNKEMVMQGVNYYDGLALPVVKGGVSSNVNATTEECDEWNDEERHSGSMVHLIGRSLHYRMTLLQKRALRITWKRLSEAPRTSGRGTIQIMEKVFDKIQESYDVRPIFFKCAFLSCLEDKKKKTVGCQQRTIATVRDHAHMLVDFVDCILQTLFEPGSTRFDSHDFNSIARIHSRLEPLGFHRALWDTFGESLAEVMFSQECVRAYPHAASAWSILSISISDCFHDAYKTPKHSLQKRPVSMSAKSLESMGSIESGPSGWTNHWKDSEWDNDGLRMLPRARFARMDAVSDNESSSSSVSCASATVLRRRHSADSLALPSFSVVDAFDLESSPTPTSSLLELVPLLPVVEPLIPCALSPNYIRCLSYPLGTLQIPSYERVSNI